MKPVYRGENGFIYETEREAAEADRIQAEKEAKVAPYRRLDALFAEKVLGLKKHPIPDPDLRPVYMRSKEPNFTYETGELHNGERWESLAPAKAYTRSLDLAWLGVEPVLQKTAYRDFDFMYKYWSLYEARFNVDKREHPEMDTCRVGMNVGHPAEAIVRACLLAVGCTEEELG